MSTSPSEELRQRGADVPSNDRSGVQVIARAASVLRALREHPDGLSLGELAKLLSLPREVAKHPTTGEPIVANLGRFGPYVQHGKVYASLGKDDDVLEIGGNRAIDLIVAKESGANSRFGQPNYEAVGADGKPMTFADAKDLRLHNQLMAARSGPPRVLFTVNVKTGALKAFTAT